MFRGQAVCDPHLAGPRAEGCPGRGARGVGAEDAAGMVYVLCAIMDLGIVVKYALADEIVG